MNSFLITFKPSKENPKRGWPLESLQALVRKCKEGKKPKVDWRFHNRRSVRLEIVCFSCCKARAVQRSSDMARL